MMHQPLSESLQDLLQKDPALGHITLNRLLDKTEGRGLYLVIILLNLPFLVPVPLPGVSVVFGLVCLFLSVRLAFDLPPRLPRFVGERELPGEKMKIVLVAGVRILRFLEKYVRPRRTQWMTWRAARFGNAALLAFLSFLLALPIPPVPPLTNLLPGYSIVFLAAAMMEEDGVIVWLGYGMSLLTTAYFIFIARILYSIFVRFLHNVL